jgi:hypothetical protein
MTETVQCPSAMHVQHNLRGVLCQKTSCTRATQWLHSFSPMLNAFWYNSMRVQRFNCVHSVPEEVSFCLSECVVIDVLHVETTSLVKSPMMRAEIK